MTTYNLKLKMLTPLFIGCGDKYDRSDYIYIPQERKVVILNEQKWINYLIDNNCIEKYLIYIQTTKFLDISIFIRNNGLQIAKIIEKCGELCLSTRHIPDFRLHEIHSFVKDVYGMPYIPGSSIKGAIISAIYGERKEERDLKLKLISVSDTSSFETDNLRLYKKIGIKIIGNQESDKEEKIPMFRECAAPDTEVNFTMTTYGDFNLQKVFEILRRKMIAMFGDNGAISNSKCAEKYLPRSFTTDGVLVLGGGAGFHSKSIVSSLTKNHFEETKKILVNKFPKHKHEFDNPISPAILKVAEVEQGNKKFMGVCKIVVANDMVSTADCKN